MNKGAALKIAQISTLDNVGGAARIAWNLHNAYRQNGHESRMLVGHKTTDDPDVIEIPNSAYDNYWTKLRRLIDHRSGIEDFNFPATSRILDLLPWKPDIIQCHNLHGGYFDLRVLPILSRKLPVVLTLHDAWLLSGHCAHSFECERWKTGCGQCPDLTIPPMLTKDTTSYNWRRKKKIYSKSRLYISTPSQWLMDKVDQSMLKTSVIKSRVIHNGVDLNQFHPFDKKKAREELALPRDARILLFAANGIRESIWKDYKTMREAVAIVADRCRKQELLFLAVGEEAPPERIGLAEIRFIPYQQSSVVARYYQAADIYLHAARAETFPNTIIEALACGTPVVATAVGGIPEQIKSLKIEGDMRANVSSRDEATGILVHECDPEAMAGAVMHLLENSELLRMLGENAVRDVDKRFDLKLQVKLYLNWFKEILDTWPIEGSKFNVSDTL